MAWHPDITNLNAGGHRYALRDQGAGEEAVVLLHGVTTYTFIWRKILPHLAGVKRVIALDLLGCGGSDMSLDIGYSLSEHAERLLPVLQQLGLKREIPGCRLLRIATGGHFIQEDEPEMIVTALKSFWDKDIVVGAVA